MEGEGKSRFQQNNEDKIKNTIDAMRNDLIKNAETSVEKKQDLISCTLFVLLSRHFGK